MAKGDDIEERLIKFAIRIIKLCDQLPKTLTGRHIAGQLLRSGTALRLIMPKRVGLRVPMILFIN